MLNSFANGRHGGVRELATVAPQVSYRGWVGLRLAVGGAGKGAPTQLALEPMGGRSCFGCVIPRRGLVIARLAIPYRLVQAALGSLAALCQ